MRRPRRWSLSPILPLLALALLGAAAPARAQQNADAALDFNRDIRPILADKCFHCHGPDAAQRKAGLRLDTRAGAFAPRDDGAAIVPGDAAASALVARITHPDPSERMPPVKSGRSLDAAQIALLVRWIDDGAGWAEHWAFVPPRPAAVPALRDPGRVRHPIDAFVQHRLRRDNLTPAPDADRRTAIRRVTFDLTGLPPTLAEVEAYLADDGPGAYERIVDRLLASPHYGEHMARFWLDAARYGDTHGLHLDNYREMWPYRDWVVEAFNRNLPYDEFAIQQLAGDLLPDATLEQQIATGFNRCHVTTNEGGSIEDEVLVRNVIDRVNTTGTVFLGLTVGCAACHDHKFDPIEQREYYQLFAFFNNLDGVPMDGNNAVHAPYLRDPSPAQSAELASIDDETAALERQITAALDRIDYAEPPAAPPRRHPLREVVWVDDALPAGATAGGDGLEWVESPAPVHRGSRAARRRGDGNHQHFFARADTKLPIAAGDRLFAWVFLDPSDPPQQIMLQWNDDGRDGWGHRAYWGANEIGYGADGTTERRRLGDLPAAGAWTKLEVDAAAVGLHPGLAVHGIAFTQFGGTAYWDSAGIATRAAAAPADHLWIDDDTPSGAVLAGDGATWSWVGGADAPVLHGARSLRRSGGPHLNQDYFTGAAPLRLQDGDVLFAHVWLDPDDPPQGIQLQFHAGGWGHRARWGEACHGAGANHGADFVAGALPPRGEWVRLEVSIADVGLAPGTRIDGWAFTQRGGTVHWDAAGVHTWAPPDQRHHRSMRVWEQRAAADSGLPEPVRAALAVAAAERDDAHRRRLRRHYLRHVYRGPRPGLAPLEERVAALVKRRRDLLAAMPTTLVMRERAEPRPAHILRRGQYDAPGEPVTRATPAALPPMDPALPRDRLGLAHWMVDPEHPLTARVAVNRFWQQLFGTGIVKTSEDFGNQGERPSHPELLDWLAADFVASGWDTKRLMRDLVTSTTYRQASAATATDYARDPGNRLLARGPRFRLDAETLRDQALAVSGLLVDQRGGPGVKPPQPAGLWQAVAYVGSNTERFVADRGPDKVHRRSLYTFWKRTAPAPQLTTFDAPSRESCVVRRERTNTPLQALLLLNDPQYVEAARHLARRAMREGGPTTRGRAAHAFALATCRPPDAADLADLVAVFAHQRARFGRRPDAARALLGVGTAPTEPAGDSPVGTPAGDAPPDGAPDGDVPPGDALEGDALDGDALDWAAWTVVANLILNLDEVITKG